LNKMKLWRFFHLKKDTKLLLIRAFFLVWITRIGMVLLPVLTVKKVLDTLSRHSDHRSNDPIPPERIAWAVMVASHSMPKPTCLLQALATQALLAQEGMSSDLNIGVMKGTGVSFEEKALVDFHAWVEADGRIVIGGTQLNRYTILLSLKRDAH
jgi:hypothetical protein